MPLPREHLLDELATAYVQAIAAVAGATISVSRRDYGVDGAIKQIATTGKDGYFETGFPVEFQLKGTSVATALTDIINDLKVRNYNLIVTRRPTATPYYLFLVCFGSDPAQWVTADTALTLNASAFWWTAAGIPSENAASVRIEIPAANRLTFEAIGTMLKSIGIEVCHMIDAGPSLKAAEGLRAVDLLAYLVGNGWSARPSRVDGISILSKDVPGASQAAEFILPVKPGFEEEHRRVADALRTIEAIEERPLQTIVGDVRRVAAKNVKKLRGRALRSAGKKRSPVKKKKVS